MVIDSKYKPLYKHGYEINDVRQLSAYARDKGTLKKINIAPAKWRYTVLDCLIVYPDQTAENTLNENRFFETPINQFEKFYKVGISIPEITSK
jgi:hypothetical protein